MKRFCGYLIVVIAIILPQHTAVAQRPPANPVGQALEEEVRRAMDVLKRQGDPAPYFIGYEVNDTTSVDVSASFGGIETSDSNHQRLLDVEVRVGDYALDSTHQIRGQRGGGSPPNRTNSVLMPLDNDIDALKSVVWLDTDRKYKAAMERFIQVKSNKALKVEESDTSADLSREPVQKAVLPTTSTAANVSDWEKKAKAYSAIFKDYPEILQGTAGFTVSGNDQYIVNSEGTSVRHSTLQYRLSLYANTKAEDGMDLYRFEAFDAHSADGMPSDAKVRETIDKMVKDLKTLRIAPLVEPFTGPAILSGRASGVFFHEIFGHRIEGQRQKGDDEGQTFTKQVNQQILPTFLTVVDDPTTEKVSGVDLNGYYKYDDEGVIARPVTVVENGILRNFLLSRSPVAGFEESNGHGRKQPGYRAVGRQGNLIVKAANTVTEPRLKEMLIEEAKKQGKPYGLFFDDISGGFTLTGRDSPQSFQVTPIMVYKVYVDGRPDELVRGADLIGTPLTSFSKIVAAGNKTDVFNGFCGAESGYIPVSAVAPAILTTQIEVQKKAKSSERMPILPPPPTGGN